MSTGSPVLRPGACGAGSFVHPALFYRGEVEYLAGTVPFVRDGLAAGEPVAVAVPGRNLELLRDQLGGDAERVRLLNMSQVGRNPGRIIPGVLRAFADAHPGRPVRIVGEPIWPARSELEYPACAQHEALINMAFAGRDVTVLCPYDAEWLAPHVLADAEVTHPVLIDGDRQRDSHTYSPERIVDTYNQPLSVPAQVVAAAEFSTGRDVAQIRRLVGTHAEQAGLADDRIADVELVVTELVSNSIEHGGGTGTMRLWTAEEHLVCEVRDRGTLTDPLAGRRPARPGHPRGRGLLLVNQLTDLVRMHTDSNGTTLRVHFHI